MPEGDTNAIDVGSTLAATAIRQGSDGSPALPLRPVREDLHGKVHQALRRRLVVFAVDLSDSMGAGPQSRLGAALGAALALTRESYLNRDQVSLVTFRDTAAQVVVPPTGSIYLVRRRLKKLAIGGATPLADGLGKALQVIRQARVKYSGIDPLLVLISDGEATSAIRPDGDPVAEALEAAKALHREQIPAILIDTSNSVKSVGIMPRLAEILAVPCRRVHALNASRLLDLIDRSNPLEKG